MDYYTRKTYAVKKVDSMLESGVPIPQIILAIETSFGFGKKFVEGRISNLEAVREGLREVEEEIKENAKHGKNRKC